MLRRALSTQFEFLTERDFRRSFSCIRIFRIDGPATLTFVGPVVFARLAARVPEETMAACGAELELRGLSDQLWSQGKLHARSFSCACVCEVSQRVAGFVALDPRPAALPDEPEPSSSFIAL